MKLNNIKKIRLFFISLIFSFLLTNCGNREVNNPGEAVVSIQWDSTKAVSILVPRVLFADVPDDSIEQWLHVHLAIGHSSPAILGEYAIVEEGVVFRPLIAFTPGLKYEVRLKSEPISQLEIPIVNSAAKPAVLAIYPTSDTLPENLLKIYVEFSRPMQEGKALEYIHLVKNNRDTVPAVFLDLQPELWNRESTILTVWFDPGRIKRDLQPNLAMGPPLQPGMKYQLLVQPGWPGKDGGVTEDTYQKEFITGPRDSISPDPAKWVIEIPKPGSDQPVEVILHESLDYLLLKNAIRILDEKEVNVPGNIDVNAEEKSFNFTPSSPWKAGKYILEIESRLEDNAGNNLNRPFDNDLTQKQTASKEVVRRVFQIR